MIRVAPLRYFVFHINKNSFCFDLDDYFPDPNMDPLTYIITGNSSITVKINSSTNIVSFSQPTRWTGTEYIIFNATDDSKLQC